MTRTEKIVWVLVFAAGLAVALLFPCGARAESVWLTTNGRPYKHGCVIHTGPPGTEALDSTPRTTS